MSRAAALFAFVLLGACSTPQTCAGYFSEGSSSSLRTEFGAGSCQDDHYYGVVCARAAAPGNFACECQVDGRSTGRTFQRADAIPSVDPDSHPAAEIANAGCGWELRR